MLRFVAPFAFLWQPHLRRLVVLKLFCQKVCGASHQHTWDTPPRVDYQEPRYAVRGFERRGHARLMDLGERDLHRLVGK